MGSTDLESLDDIKNWLGSRGIAYKDALHLQNQVKQHYPYLYQAIKANRNVRADLEVVELIHNIREGRFPPEYRD